MGSIQRRKRIIEILEANEAVISASVLAKELHVSRQIIVSDIALLRAKDYDILSTPRGYVMNRKTSENEVTFKIACSHSEDLLQQEIYTIVDHGGRLIDVIVEHPIYGQLTGQLNIISRYDADDFLEKVAQSKISLLCHLTDGIHLHTISCDDSETADRIREALCEAKILLT